MFKKIVVLSILIAVIATFVLAHPPHGGGHSSHPLNLLPTVEINLSGLLGLLKQPPIPIVNLPPIPDFGLGQLLNKIPIPAISLPFSDKHHGGYPGPHHGGHGGLDMLTNSVGDILDTITGGSSHDGWSSWA